LKNNDSVENKTIVQLEAEGKQSIMKRLGEISGLINVVILALVIMSPFITPIIGPLLGLQAERITRDTRIDQLRKDVDELLEFFPRTRKPFNSQPNNIPLQKIQ